MFKTILRGSGSLKPQKLKIVMKLIPNNSDVKCDFPAPVYKC